MAMQHQLLDAKPGVGVLGSAVAVLRRRLDSQDSLLERM